MKRRSCKFLSGFLVGVLLVSVMLSGCGKKPAVVEQNVEDGAISGIRTGIARQGISGQFKSFEVTDDRSYFMSNVSGVPVLYYCLHGTDQVVPLCTISGCKHEGAGCEACFPANGNVCYDEGQLYVSAGQYLYRLNPDGSGRTKILDVLAATDGDYDGIAEPMLWNGVFSFYLTRYSFSMTPLAYDMELYDPYYFKLDGSMEKPEPMENLVVQYNDGASFIMRGPAQDADLEEWLLYSWNPEKNESRLLYDASDIICKEYEPSFPLSEEEIAYFDQIFNAREVARRYEQYGEGYWGAECAYYLEQESTITNNLIEKKVNNNLIYKLNYSDGSRELLLDTGLTGSYRLSCFPDFLVLIETVRYSEERGCNLMTTKPMLYFYNWDFELIGQCDLEALLRDEERLGVYSQNIICGETADRIYLSTRFLSVPEYYIEKADFENGTISLHPLKYNSVDLDEIYRADMERKDNLSF